MTKLQFTEEKVNLGLEVHVSIGNSVNSYSSLFFFFFFKSPPPPNEDVFFQKPLLYSSSIIAHSHYSIRLNL